MAASWMPISHLEILLAFACFLFLGHTFLRNKNTKKKEAFVAVNWPLLGMLPYLLLNISRFHDWTTDILRRSVGCTFVFHGPWFSAMEMVCTCDPSNVRHIMCTNSSNYPKGPEFARIFEVLGDGIFNADADMWILQRKMGHSVISGSNFRRLVAKSGHEKVDKGLLPLLHHMLRAGQAFDLQDVFQRFTFDATCILVFGTDPASLSSTFPTVPFSKAMDDAMEALLLRHIVPESWWMLMSWLNIGHEKKLAEAKKTIDCFIHQQISKTRDELSKRKSETMTEEEEEAEDHVDMSSGGILASYISSSACSSEDTTGITKSDKFLRDSAVNFMLAGRDTTSSALTWFFWLISNNPRVEMKILEELKRVKSTKHAQPKVLHDDGGGGEAEQIPCVFDAEELSGLVYLHAALCDSLRLFPPVPFEHKGVVQQEVLPTGEMVRPNTKVLISLFSMGRMESIWGEDCLDFKPERWISERGRLKFQPSYKFMAFNAGPRICLGREVAFTQMKLVVAAVLYNFQVEVVAGHPVEPKNSIILHTKSGFMVRVRRRKLSSCFLLRSSSEESALSTGVTPP
ncbi:hypothetical protein ACLOJK_041107 [Asimina triloba]